MSDESSYHQEKVQEAFPDLDEDTAQLLSERYKEIANDSGFSFQTVLNNASNGGR